MKKLKQLILVAAMAVAPSAFAKAPTYASSIATAAAIEKELQACAPSPDEAPECYMEAEEKYSQMISSIRNTYRNKVDQKLWQSINLNFKKQGDLCRTDFMLSGDFHFFYLYKDCLTNNLHSLAITAIELHLK